MEVELILDVRDGFHLLARDGALSLSGGVSRRKQIGVNGEHLIAERFVPVARHVFFDPTGERRGRQVHRIDRRRQLLPGRGVAIAGLTEAEFRLTGDGEQRRCLECGRRTVLHHRHLASVHLVREGDDQTAHAHVLGRDQS